MTKRTTTKEFVKRSNLIHQHKYDYSRCEYIRNNSKVTIICLQHGAFQQIPMSHLSGAGCPTCGRKKASRTNSKTQKLTTDEFIERAKATHGDRYDYSLTKYNGCQSIVEITCKQHGLFKQEARVHTSGSGCTLCRDEASAIARSKNQDQIIEGFIKTHGQKYDYSTVDYKSFREKVRIICPSHGEFLQYPRSHKKGAGCTHCKIYSAFKRKEYLLGKSVVEVQGYEPYALDLLLEQGFKPKHLEVGKDIPIISYDYNGTQLTYYPDIFIPKKNLLIEVKSIYTWRVQKKKNKAKLKGARLAGFNTRLLVFRDDGSVYLDRSRKCKRH